MPTTKRTHGKPAHEMWDHPAVLLDGTANAFGAKHLREHEALHGVTFAALHTETLDALRESYAEWASSENDNARLRGIDGVLNAVRDLFGLGE